MGGSIKLAAVADRCRTVELIGGVMINIKNILCPVDFFPASDAAVNYAAGLAANYDAAIHLLHVDHARPCGCV